MIACVVDLGIAGYIIVAVSLTVALAGVVGLVRDFLALRGIGGWW